MEADDVDDDEDEDDDEDDDEEEDETVDGADIVVLLVFETDGSEVARQTTSHLPSCVVSEL